MQPKTEEFLNPLLWSADILARPTFRNLTDSYESWAYRNGLMRQVATLQEQQLLERDASTATDRLYRLTAQGRLHVLGGRDPEERWARRWDGQMAARALRRAHGTKRPARTAATLSARQGLRLPAKQRVDHARSTGGGTTHSRRREDQRRIAAPA